MVGVKTKVTVDMGPLKEAVDKAAYESYFHAAASIRKDAIASIESARGPSMPGTPVHTHRRALARRAIRFSADKYGAVIGPVASVLGTALSAHEFGGMYKGTRFPKRPTMGPALLRGAPRFAGQFSGRVGT